jgi:nitronate monooxygenase
MLADSSADDVIVSAGLTGTPASWLRPALIANGLDPDALPSAPPRSCDSTQSIASKRWMDVRPTALQWRGP